METKLWVVGVVLFCALLGALGQLFFKLGSSSVTIHLSSWLLNWEIILGMSFYALSAILFIFSLKHGRLSVLYPLIATSYIWVTLLSVFVLGEAVSVVKWLGIGLIIVGISLTVRSF